jgi:hypothetical protein
LWYLLQGARHAAGRKAAQQWNAKVTKHACAPGWQKTAATCRRELSLGATVGITQTCQVQHRQPICTVSVLAA